MMSINQRFGKHCSCHFQVECIMGRVLEAFCRACSRWRVPSVGSKDFYPKSQNLFQQNLESKIGIKVCWVKLILTRFGGP
jgi:hypothetical protein